MAKYQIALKLNELTEALQVDKSHDISTGLTDNAADFTGITPNAAAIETATAAAAAAITTANNLVTAAKQAVLAKAAALATMRDTLTKAAKWTESNISDPLIAAKVFPLKQTATPAPADLAQVLNLVLGFGSMAGKVNANWEKTPRAVSYEVQVRYRDIAGSPWATVKTLSATRFTIPGLTSGQIVQVRVRAIGPKSLEGDWSDLAEHMVP
ncbi:MAG: fibronectin type III domain-containing protein [Chthoniobacteraceae bacterium]